MYEDIIKDKIDLNIIDGTYSISIDKNLNEEDLYKSIAFILGRTLLMKTGSSYKVGINVCDSHVSFNVRKR